MASGAGLPGAMTGLDAVVDVLQGPSAVLVDGVRRALAAASAEGVGHVVSLSIVGVDRVHLRYYRAKVAQEAEVRTSGVPWSVVRATQFHSLVAGLFAAGARGGVLPLVRAPIQPVDVRDVAGALVDRVEAGPDGAVSHFGGPRVERLDRLARAWAAAEGVRRLPLPLPLPAAGSMLRAVRDGGLTDPTAARGRVGFHEWLRAGT